MTSQVGGLLPALFRKEETHPSSIGTAAKGALLKLGIV